MLNKLSNQFSKEIALSLLSIFTISGLQALSAGIGVNNHPHSFYQGNINKNLTNNAFPEPGSLSSSIKEHIALKSARADGPLIGGPSQPEMTAFKSVGSDNMVSPFTGNFSYNIPLMDVGGYPINLAYSSGISMEDEASWVGLGWNINPGTITRNMRGIPDDFDGSEKIVKTQSFRPDETWGVNTGADVRLFGNSLLSLGIQGGLSYNNKLGVAVDAGVNAGISLGSKSGSTKTASLSFGAALNTSSRNGVSVTPSISLSMSQQQGNSGSLSGSIGGSFTYSSRTGISSMHVNTNVSYKTRHDVKDENGKVMMDEDGKAPIEASESYRSGFNSSLSFGYPTMTPVISRPLTNQSFAINLAVGGEAWWVNPTLKLGGFYSISKIADDDKRKEYPAFGIMHVQEARNNDEALLDFNRANDGIYTPNSPNIAMPVYTFDVFSMTGEGTGGSFRIYRGDLGYMKDPKVESREEQGSAALDVGFGNIIEAGASINSVFTPSESGDWTQDNAAGNVVKFTGNESNKPYEATYFKNPGEKAIPDADFQNAVGGEDLVRYQLGNPGTPTPVLLPRLITYDRSRNLKDTRLLTAATKRAQRDKRVQVISYLTAEESEKIGTNKRLYSFPADNPTVYFGVDCQKPNVTAYFRSPESEHPFPDPLGAQPEVGEAYRKKHHISEIDVLNQDGKKYVYGLPVYNTRQVEMTFSSNSTTTGSLTNYSIAEAGENNIYGRDWMVSKEEMPAYTHSFLLTEILSPNYVDVTGNGLTEDDMGDGIKFNYSRSNDFNWRTPVGANLATFNEGLKTDPKDNTAHYIFGTRESWYLYSIESKNMVARFYIASDRRDGKSVVDEYGAVDYSAANAMKRLDKICLYSKAALKKDPNAKPIQTVKFNQTYRLCKNMGGQSSNSEYGYGKLTLESVEITYNGRTKVKRKYVLGYSDDNNPDYNFDASDRWGTYKPSSQNPAQLANKDFPYSIQPHSQAETDQVNKNVAAWALNRILLPSGAIIHVDYESDTYAYVQDKRACDMMQILGFGMSETNLPATNDLKYLYQPSGGTENNIIYVSLPTAVNNKDEFFNKYLRGLDQLYMKLSVDMPYGNGLSGTQGTETIGVYSDFDANITSPDYGIIGNNVGWLRVANLTGGHTPMVQTALQFLMRNLPGKAYKGFDVSDQSDGEAVVQALAGAIHNIAALGRGETGLLMKDNKCRSVQTSTCFIRLCDPEGNKYGGGHRVKKITIQDNWDRMSGQEQSTYGQEYLYTTKELVNGQMQSISSGVACWEPGVGNDENPHKVIARYLDHNKGGPYDFGMIEMPLGEMYYPGASVGYSHVEIISIHKDNVKNPPTKTVKEFYTTKDFPYRSVATDLTGDANCKYKPANILKLLKIDLRQNVTLSQGFLIETNDMDGKERKTSTYKVSDPNVPISYTEYFYNVAKATDNTYRFNHEFSVLRDATGTVTQGIIGRDIELMSDFREFKTQTITVNTDFYFNGSMAGPFFVGIPMGFSPITKESTMYRSAGLLKVVTHYGMIDSIVVVDKGSMVSTKNLVYDAETGNPLVTRTENIHNRSIYNTRFPAHWAYQGMGPAYKNIDFAIDHAEIVHGRWNSSYPITEISPYLESGDELFVDKQPSDPAFVFGACDPETAPLPTDPEYPWTTQNLTRSDKIWVLFSGKPDQATGEWIFIDENGYPVKLKDAKLRIIRSGKRNLMDATVFSITSLKTPIDPVTNKLILNDDIGIINTTAATYKENWRVDDAYVQKTEKTYNDVAALVHRLDIPSSDFITVLNDEYHNDHLRRIYREKALTLFHAEWGKKKQSGWKWGKYENVASYLLFDYNNPILNGKTIYNVTLGLYAHSNALFPVGNTYPVATHTTNNEWSLHLNDGSGLPIHTDHSFGNTPLSTSAEIRSLKTSWYPASSSYTDLWVNNYLNSNNYVSQGKGIIPPANFLSQNYLDNNGINVTLPFKENSGTPLGYAKKIGLRLRLNTFDMNGDGNPRWSYRCFWSSNVQGPCLTKTAYYNQPNNNCSFANPYLSIYYYECGDSSQQYGYPTDYRVNRRIICRTVQNTVETCKSKFQDEKSMNPYAEGVLGNWRTDQTWVYYGERKEKDINSTVDTRIGGTIYHYQNFWNWAATSNGYLTKNSGASGVWVWNSEITQFNRKGYEIENTDPLGRFNSGLYGYNQQLPVAVANNAMLREILFDGFEDYTYKSSESCETCKSHYYKFTEDISNAIIQDQHHSGRSSLKIPQNSHYTLEVPAAAETSVNLPYGLEIHPTTAEYTAISLSGGQPGSGLDAEYYNYSVPNGYDDPLDPSVNTSALITTASHILPRANPTIAMPGQVATEYFSIRWKGKLQAPRTGVYILHATADDGYRIKIDGSIISPVASWNNPSNDYLPVNFIAGQIYDLQIDYYNDRGPYNFMLEWRIPQPFTGFTPISANYLYGESQTQYQNVVNSTQYCQRVDKVQVTGNALTDQFNPIQGRKMIFSAWVKQRNTDCNCSAYTEINVTVKNGDQVIATFSPKGNIIEGWQRIEEEFTIPPDATQLDINLNNNINSGGSDNNVYFDDIRVLPKNSNLKSFVYDPLNLRLMAELDENNFASFYEYDDDGTLVRVKKETERGVKTITETRSEMQKNIIDLN